MSITIADYLFLRLQELGISHIFGIPGDYNLELLDHVIQNKHLNWIGNCNELNGAYAADGYARVQGMAALITTFGVGELSTMNGIAGAYAESIPLIHIVGMPGLALQNKKNLLHHNICPDNYLNFMNMHVPITAAQVMLTTQHPDAEIDRLLQISWIEKRPVYIGIPADIVAMPVEPPSRALQLSPLSFDEAATCEAAEKIAQFLLAAKKPIIVVDGHAQRYHFLPLVQKFIDESQYPFVSTAMGKGLIDETHSQFLGLYMGKCSQDAVLKSITESDCVLSFGWVRSDLNTGAFSDYLNLNHSLDIQKNTVRLQHATYAQLSIEKLIPLVLERLGSSPIQPKQFPPKKNAPFTAGSQEITETRFWQRIESFFRPDDVILAELGTSFFGLLGISLPQNTKVISQVIWESIGYTLGALLGAMIAAPQKRHLLFIGDGALQETGQEISTLLYHQLSPIIFLINNDGYTIERFIHGEKAVYNDLQKWNYQALPHVFGNNVWSAKVSSEHELEAVLSEIEKHRDKLVFIEVVMARMDAPFLLRKYF